MPTRRPDQGARDAGRYDLPPSHLENPRGSSQARIVSWVPPGSRVLDLGCAAGLIASSLARDKGCVVVGVESSPELAEKARAHCSELLVADLESDETFRKLGERHAPFDAIILADVLEHLRRPEATLAAASELLGPTGTLLVSLPNVANWRVRSRLLFGRFDYTDDGILDRTHLRFYTRRSAAALLTGAGLHIEEESWTAGSGRWLPWTLARLVPGLLAFQLLYKARRTSAKTSS